MCILCGDCSRNQKRILRRRFLALKTYGRVSGLVAPEVKCKKNDSRRLYCFMSLHGFSFTGWGREACQSCTFHDSHSCTIVASSSRLMRKNAGARRRAVHFFCVSTLSTQNQFQWLLHSPTRNDLGLVPVMKRQSSFSQRRTAGSISIKCCVWLNLESAL